MCRVTVTCNCGSGTRWPALLGLGLLCVVVVVPILAALLEAIVAAIAIGVGIVVAGWVLARIAETVIEEWSLRRHNERMAQIHPHVRAHLERIRPGAAQLPPNEVHAITSAPARGLAAGPVRIYPTPRKELDR